MGPFGFLDMAGTQKERAVDRYEVGKLTVDTCAVTDADQPYETAVAHPAYNNGAWVIVEMYDTREAAQQGHKRWVEKMTAKKLPGRLVDTGMSQVNQLCDALGSTANWREYKRETDNAV